MRLTFPQLNAISAGCGHRREAGSTLSISCTRRCWSSNLGRLFFPPPSALVYAPRVAPAAPRADLNPSNMFRNAARVKVRSRRYQALRVGSQSGARHRGFLAFSGVLQSNPVQIRSRDVRIFDLRPCGGMYARLRP